MARQRSKTVAPTNGNKQAEAYVADSDAQARRAALYAELGNTGITRFGTYGRYGQSVVEEKLRQLQGREGRELYRQMRLNHPVVAAILYALSWALRKVSFKPVGASDAGLDAEAVQFLEEAYGDMSFSPSDTMSFIVDPMLEQGFSLVELVYKKRLGMNPPRYGGAEPGQEMARSQYRDGLIGWRKWAPRPATTLLSGGEWQFDESGGIQGVWQEGLAPKYQTTFIPIERLLHFTTTRAPANSPEAISVLRAMYWPYYYSSQIAEVEAIGIERRLNGLPVMYLGKGASLDTGVASDYTLAQSLVTNIRQDGMAGVVIPAMKMNADGQGMLLELLSSTGNVTDTDIVLNRYHKLMALTALAQFIFLGMENTGALATGRVQSGFFNMALNGWATNVADIYTRHANPRLLALNPKFAALEEIPHWEHSDAGVPDLEMLAEFINKTVGAAVLTPDENLEAFVRETAGLPEKVEPLEVETKMSKGEQPDEGDVEAATGDEEPEPEEKSSERFADLRTAPGNPAFERETNAYQRALEEAYATWYARTGRDVAAADDDAQEEIIAAALAALGAQMVRLGREHLPRAVTVGAGSALPTPATWAAMQQTLAENERYIGDSLIPAIGERLRAAAADEDIASGGAVSLSGVLQTFAGRIAMYAGAMWSLLHVGWMDKVRAADERAGEMHRVRWVLDAAAKHCPDCPALAVTYDSIRALEATGRHPASGVACGHRCRCHLEFERNGTWTR